MAKRKHISDRTFAAMALLALGKIPYEHAKAMGETNFLSLWVRDHNILHSSEHPDRDEFWNMTPMLLAEHREKTKRDMKIIAKSRRIRKKKQLDDARYAARREELVELSGMRRKPALLCRLRSREQMLLERLVVCSNLPSSQWDHAACEEYLQLVRGRWHKRKLRSRGFDRTRRRKMDGTVVKR
jgi:hypothetical protein